MMLYLGISDLPIYNFDKILKTNNLSYLVVKWNERKEIKVPKKASKRWDDIYNQYCKATENNEALTYYSLITELSYLESRYIIVHTLISTLNENNKKDFGERFKKLDIAFDVKKTVISQAKDLKRQLRIAKQEIDITTGKVKKLKSDDDPSSIINQKIKLERITGLKINLRKTSVEEWIEIHNEAEDIVKQQREARNG